ncbi:hypothetical protein M2347_003927 [Chryseobacterium sp. H1D6B]|uniref:hypothetical protein n=1 Tax=Chryseobacterium sp. H1D6B TaxID=2940588 RepID=UPI0015CDFF23|nr:hypothetical protein [Chryseobacterium sp. H1D6B]MDH6254200.1 hypothetical protein [Chryseobacterium sp. H1D6B]
MNQEKKTIFTSSLFDFENVEDNNQKSIENYSRIINTGDHRSRIVLAGIIVESYFDRLLKCFFIDYKNLSDRSDFTFSFKISLLKSMRIIPNEIIVLCDMIRKVRNIFAHNFEIDVIDDIDPKLVKNINQLYREKTKSKIEKELIEKFHSLYSLGYSELRAYEKNVKLLRETVDDENFEKDIQKINESRRHIFYENLRKGKPIKTIDRGNGEIEEVFSQGLSVIRKKQ